MDNLERFYRSGWSNIFVRGGGREADLPDAGKKTLDSEEEWTDVTGVDDLGAAGWRLPFRRRSAASLRLVRGGHASRSPVACGLGFALGIFFKAKVEMR